MKAIIGETGSLRSFAIISKDKPLYTWKEQIENFVFKKQIPIQLEARALESLARELKINSAKFDCLPYGEFLDEIHKQLQKIKHIEIKTDGGYNSFRIA